jgi:hypothetical protein
MIILDLNQVMISNLMVQLGNHTNHQVEEDLLRHMILNSIRLYRQKFSSEYGELVIACDDKNYWRRKVYPYYKANRKKAREKSELDWTKIFEALNKIRAELREVFPYPTIQVDSVEADDVIATLCSLRGATVSSERILILSGDKDFNQLQKYGNVEQFDPVRKKWIKTDDPYKYVQEHIMRGDTGDGIPNFLSDDDTFVSDKRQKPLTQKKIDAWLGKDPSEFCDDMMLRNYKRNQQLVDFEFIPEDVKTRILDEYKAQSGKTRDRLFNYFIQNKLKNLMEVIGDF